MRPWPALVAAAILLGAALAGYAAFSTPPASLRQGAYVEGGIGTPGGLNPLLHRDPASRRAWGPLFDGLVTVDGQGRVAPGLAETWEVSDDGREWTFRLRRNVTWHDGRPFTAADVAFTFESLAHPAFPGSLGSAWTGRSVHRPDEHTVAVTLPEPDFGFLYELDLPILPRHLLAGTPLHLWAEASFSGRPVGTGPYLLESWDREAGELRYQANPAYFRGAPAIPRLVYLAEGAGDPDSFRRAGLAGGPISREAASAFYLRGFRVYRWPSPWYYAVVFNLREDRVLADPLLRQAWVEAGAERVEGTFPVDHPFFAHSWIAPQAPAGLAGRLVAGLLRLFQPAATAPAKRVALLVWDSGEPERAIAGRLKQRLPRAGFEVEIRALPFSELLSVLVDPAGDWDALVWRWDLVPNPDVTDLFHSARTPWGGPGGRLEGGANLGGYANPEVDRLLEEARHTPPGPALGDLLARVAGLLARDRPYQFLWAEEQYFAVRREVRGVDPGPFATHWNLWAWRLAGRR